MPPAVHPGWIYWSVRGQTSSKTEGGGEGASMTPREVNRCGGDQHHRSSAYSPTVVDGHDVGHQDKWICEDVGEELQESISRVSNSRVLLPQRTVLFGCCFVYRLTPVTAWEQFLISLVWLICEEQKQSFSLDTRPKCAAHVRARTESSMAYVLMKWASTLQIHREKTSPRRRGIRPLEESGQDFN